MAFDYSIPRDVFLEPLKPGDEILYFYYDEHSKILCSKFLHVDEVFDDTDTQDKHITVTKYNQGMSDLYYVSRKLLGWKTYVFYNISDFQHVIKVNGKHNVSMILKLRMKIRDIINRGKK